jgi:hypothetical protein
MRTRVKVLMGYIGEQPILIKPVTYRDSLQEVIDVPIIYYDGNETNKEMTVDVSELKEVMG